MDIVVVVDCDWFIIGKQPFVKVLSYAWVGGEKNGDLTFSLPQKAAQFSPNLTKQARHSHGLVWSTEGEYDQNQLPEALTYLFDIVLRKRPSACIFYAKGLQKCQLLETWLPTVYNLEDLGCPRFDQLTNKPLSTQNKAIVFSAWLSAQRSGTLLPPVTLAAS